MTEQHPLQQLEQRIEELVNISSRLRRENHAMQVREQKLMEERADLLRKNDIAKSKVEAIISRLKSLEQEP